MKIDAILGIVWVAFMIWLLNGHAFYRWIDHELIVKLVY